MGGSSGRAHPHPPYRSPSETVAMRSQRNQGFIAVLNVAQHGSPAGSEQERGNLPPGEMPNSPLARVRAGARPLFSRRRCPSSAALGSGSSLRVRTATAGCSHQGDRELQQWVALALIVQLETRVGGGGGGGGETWSSYTHNFQAGGMFSPVCRRWRNELAKCMKKGLLWKWEMFKTRARWFQGFGVRQG